MSEADSTKAAYDEKKVSRRYQPEAETSSDDTDSSSSSSSSSSSPSSSPCCSSSPSSPSSSSDSSSCGAGADSNSENDDYGDCQHETKEFLIRETNFDQGQLKLKISAKRKSVRKRVVLCPPSSSDPLDTGTRSPPSTSSVTTNTTTIGSASSSGTTPSNRAPLDITANVTDQRPPLKITIKQPHQSSKNTSNSCNLPELTKEQKQLNADKSNPSVLQQLLPPPPPPQHPPRPPPLQHQQAPINQEHFKDVCANSSNLVHAVPFTSRQQKVSRIKQKNRNRIASQYDNQISSESVKRQSFEKHWPPVQLGKNFPTSAGKCSSYDSSDCVRRKTSIVSSGRLKDSEILSESGGVCIESTEDAASEAGGDYQAFSKYEQQNEINLNFISPKDPKKSNGAAPTGQIQNESASDILNRSDVSPDSGIQSFPGTPVRNDSPSHTLLPSSDPNQVESSQILSGNQINQCISAVAGPSISSQQVSATTSINTFTTKPTSTVTTTASQVTLTSISCDLNRQICDTRTDSSGSDSKHMGRRRGRGRPPKRAKNSWILQNKKSLIYARLYGEARDTDVIERTPFSNITLPERVQTNNHSEVNEYPLCQPVVPHKIVDKTFQSDVVNKPLSSFQNSKFQHEDSCISPTRENKQTIPDHCLPIKKVKKSKISSVEPLLPNNKSSLFDDGKEANLFCPPKVPSMVQPSSDICSKAAYDNISYYDKTNIYPNGKQHANLYPKYEGGMANPTKAAGFPACLGQECCQQSADLFEFKDSHDDIPGLKRTNEHPFSKRGNETTDSSEGISNVSYFKSNINAQLNISNLSHARKQDCLPCYKRINDQQWGHTPGGQLVHQRLIDLSTSKIPNDFSVHRFDPFLNMVPKTKIDIASKTALSLIGSKKADAACQSFSKKKNSITSDDIPSLQKADFDGLKSMKDASIPNRLGDTLPSRMYEDSPPILMRAEDLPCSEKVKDPPRLEEYGAPQAIKRAESRRKKAENLSKFKKAERQFVTLREGDITKPRIENLAARKSENEKISNEIKSDKIDRNISCNEITNKSVTKQELEEHQKATNEVPEESGRTKYSKNMLSKKNSQKHENFASSTTNNETNSVSQKPHLQQLNSKKVEDLPPSSQKVDTNNLLSNSENALVPSRVQTPPVLSKKNDHLPSKQQKQPPSLQQQHKQSSGTELQEKKLLGSSQQHKPHIQKQPPQFQQQSPKAPPQLQQQKQHPQLKQQKGNQQKVKPNSQQKTPPPLPRHPPQLAPQISPPPKLQQKSTTSKHAEPSQKMKDPPKSLQTLPVRQPPQLQQEPQTFSEPETQLSVKTKRDEESLVPKKLCNVEKVKNLSKKAANNLVSQLHQENGITNQQLLTKKKGVTNMSKKFGVPPGTKCTDKLSKVSVEQSEVEKLETLPPVENSNTELAKGKKLREISVSKKNKESVLQPVPSRTEEQQSTPEKKNETSNVAGDTTSSLPDPLQQVPRPKKAKKCLKLPKETSNKKNPSDDLVKLAEECFQNAKAAQQAAAAAPKNVENVPKPKIKKSGITKHKKIGIQSSVTTNSHESCTKSTLEPGALNSSDEAKSSQPEKNTNPASKSNSESRNSEVNNLVNGNKIRRKPGRPKGSKNKILVTKAFRSEKLARTTHCQPEKKLQNAISNDCLSPNKMARKSTRVQLCSQKQGMSSPAKRPRGRPRKNNTDNALQPLENKRSRHLEESSQNGVEPETTEVIESKRRTGFGQKMPPEEGDFDSLIRSVHDSIKSQFHGQDETEDFNDFNFSDNLDTIEPTLVNVCMQQEPKPTRVAPKIRRPKLHVMMRRPRRGRRKKKNIQASGSQSFLRNSFSSNVNMQSKASFASFTSNNIHLNQPCFTTEGNTFSMFTATTISDKDQTVSKTGFHSQSFKKFTRQYTNRKLINKKKKKRMLYFRSKHKNIVDPVFLADLDVIIGQFDSLIISESLDQIRRFNIGDKPMPSIFRLAKIINRKKKKERQVPYPPNPVSSDYPHDDPSYQFPPHLSPAQTVQQPFHQSNEKPKKLKLRKEMKEKNRKENSDRCRKESIEKHQKEQETRVAHKESNSKNRKEIHEKVNKESREVERLRKGSSLDRTPKVSSLDKVQKTTSMDRGRKGSLDRRRKDVTDKTVKDLTSSNTTNDLNTKYLKGAPSQNNNHSRDDGAKVCSDQVTNDQIPQDTVNTVDSNQVSKVLEKSLPEKSLPKTHRKPLSHPKQNKSSDKLQEKVSDSVHSDKTVQEPAEATEVVKVLESNRKDDEINKDSLEVPGKENASGHIQEKVCKELVDKPRKESLERVRRDSLEKIRKESGEKVRKESGEKVSKEKSKIVRRKSASEENLCQSSEELKMCNQQCLPPKKRHKLFSSVQSSAGMSCGLSSGKPDLVHQCTKTPEKRKVGRPRKHPLPFDDLLSAASGLEREQQSCEVEPSSVASYSASLESDKVPVLNEEPVLNGSLSDSQASATTPAAAPNRTKCSRKQAAISAVDDTNKLSNHAVLTTSPKTNCVGEMSTLQLSRDSELETDSSVISSETPCPAKQTESYTGNFSVNCHESVTHESYIDGSSQCSHELNYSKSQLAPPPDVLKNSDSCIECHTLQTQVSSSRTGRGKPKLSPEHSPDSKNAVEKIKRKLVNQSVQRLHKAGQARTKADRLLCSENSQKPKPQTESANIDDMNGATMDGQQTKPAVIYKENNNEMCNMDSEGRTSMDASNESVIESVQSENEPQSTMHRKRKRSTTGDISSTKPKRRRQDCITSVPKRSHDGFDDCHSDIPSQLPKKKYQRVGIYYEYYRNYELSCKPGLKTRDRASQQNGNIDPGLPVPLHHGKDLCTKISDFQLPYDIWWLYKNNQLVRKDDHLNYRKVRNNFYVDIKPVSPYEPHPCSCSSGLTDGKSGCGEECLNRMIYTECSPGLCPCGDNCMNNRFQKHLWAPCLEMFLTPDRGYGVRSSHHLMSGQFILEYLGEVVSENEFRRRMTENYSQERHHYCLNLDGGAMIDGYRMGNIGRFVNHSCDPNCEMQKWNVNGYYRMGLFALKDIQPYTEITYDYNFHAYNIDSQQICRCGSEKCRGVIGGRTQRLNGMNKEKSGVTRPVGRPPKDKRKSKSRLKKVKDKSKNPQDSTSSTSSKVPSQSVIKPMSNRERGFARKHRIFLVRNIDKIRQIRQKGQRLENEKDKDCDFIRDTNLSSTDMFLTKFTALKTERSVKTRRLAMADENSELTKMAKLAQICREIMCAVREYKSEDGTFIAAQLFTLPSKKKNPEFYEIIDDPIDINSIDSNINTGQYKSMECFENDILKLFRNSEKYFKRKTEKGKQVLCLRKVYNTTRNGMLPKLQEIMGTNTVNNSQNETESTEYVETRNKRQKEGEVEEEIIRCICNIYRDEGLMIQCEKCFIWQHCDCMGVKGNVANYLCEQCDPRYYPKEILMVPQPSDASPRNTYYMTLMRDDMQIHVGDCVYVMRDNLLKRSSDGTPVRTSYRLLSNISPDKLDIFRVERLWKNEKEDKFAYGHHYVRPHETFHEPYRKFFANEVFRIPLYDIIPLEAIIGTCCVLDLNTFCKGRPKGVKEQDVYICESRVDKSAHHFSKISRTRYPVLTKTYCFDKFEKRLVPKRTYSPHEVPETYKRRWPGERHSNTSEEGNNNNNKQATKKASESNKSAATTAAASAARLTASTNGYAEEQHKPDAKTLGKTKLPGIESDEDVPLVHVKQQKKRDRLDKILQKLLANIPGKQKVDVTYLLEEGAGKRPRKKPQFNF